MFDIEAYVKDSAAKSGVPAKVSDTSTLLSIASQLGRGVSKSKQDVLPSAINLDPHRPPCNRISKALENDLSA